MLEVTLHFRAASLPMGLSEKKWSQEASKRKYVFGRKAEQEDL